MANGVQCDKCRRRHSSMVADIVYLDGDRMTLEVCPVCAKEVADGVEYYRTLTVTNLRL